MKENEDGWTDRLEQVGVVFLVDEDGRGVDVLGMVVLGDVPRLKSLLGWSLFWLQRGFEEQAESQCKPG
jgi:hypothetical protein